MEIILITGMWILFVLLFCYTFIYWRHREAVKAHREKIRKAWYLLYVFGALIYLTANPNSLFTNWHNYLVVLIGFIAVDSLIFLSLYVSKIGGNELKTTEQQIEKTEKYWVSAGRKVENMEHLLNSYEYLSYTRNEEEYINELDNFLNEYGKKESLSIDVLPYHTEEKQDELLEGIKQPKSKVERVLDSRQTYFSAKDNLMLLPIFVLNRSYIAKVTTTTEDVEIQDIDGNIINMLLLTYVLAVENPYDDGGRVELEEEYGQSQY
ncbi:type II toxin-antitoxin system SpoIISA family toxin [Lentibacillus sediminis]|uniref:type II toxin-antitoxin system SpoIISA family toxin n=1 Tax=Lentibacillus sediminis TaxID=1940529 RepID=UPI000C1C7358|nr:type II toxin-antitoxin system SpoIISA family toxin [Lentibacillus sediminis]